jgi:hypothetical protein
LLKIAPAREWKEDGERRVEKQGERPRIRKKGRRVMVNAMIKS